MMTWSIKRTLSKRGALSTFAIVSLVSTWSCSEDYLVDLGKESVPGAGTWLINESFIQWGCPGKDCIPSLTGPPMVEAGSSELAYLDDDELIVGVKRGDEYYAFPHSVLDWHEVVNMEGYTISYCPLTGSAIHIKDDREYGVSGLLYNSNLIMYDRESGSYWPQMLLRSTAGRSRGEKLEIEVMVETEWGTWRRLFPETRAVSARTGFQRNYDGYPYGTYRTDASVFFPVESFDDKLHPKERVLGVITESGEKAYAVSDFDPVSILHDTVGDQNVVIFASSTDNFAVMFETDRLFSLKSYDLDNGNIAFTDRDTGSEWNIFGEAVSGPLKGEVLEYGDSFISFWFSWAAFYPETALWEGE